jgi:putative endonuclease
MAHRRTTLGAAGEGIARRHLERLGYLFVASNWRCPEGEIDLVMRDKTELVFVEVKTRRTESAGSAEESISPSKCGKLLASGLRYLAANGGTNDPIWRIDLIAITLDPSGAVSRLTHIENAVSAG